MKLENMNFQILAHIFFFEYLYLFCILNFYTRDFTLRNFSAPSTTTGAAKKKKKRK